MKETFYRISAPVSLTIAIAADLHNTKPESIIHSLRLNHPDIITIVGDFVVGTMTKGRGLFIEKQKNVLPFLTSCASIAPTYVSLGNNEWMISEEDIKVINSTGVIVLDNSWVKTQGVCIGGLTSALVSAYRAYREKTGEQYPYWKSNLRSARHVPEQSWLSEFEQQDGYRILLCHHPEYWRLKEPFLINRKIDLVLSGHAHGGQVRIFGQGLFAPGQGWMPKYTSGVYDGKLIVSRGLVNVVHSIPRIFNPAEVVYVKMGEVK